MGGAGTAGTQTERYAGIQVQTSISGVPISQGWGTFRTSCNLLWYGDFSSKAAGGKGGSGKGGGQPTAYNYSASVILGIVQGPVAGIRSVYLSQTEYVTNPDGNGSTCTGNGQVTTSDQTALELVQLTLITGELAQEPWSYLTTNHPDQALGYSGVAYVCASNTSLGQGATLDNHSFEVQMPDRVAGSDDANPADILTTFLPTVPYWISSWLGDLTNYSNYCLSVGLLLSPVIDSQRQASDFVQEILQATNSNCLWEDGQMKVVPYGDTAVGAYVPNLTPEYDLTDDDFIPASKGDDPVLINIASTAEAYNKTQVEFYDRTNAYNSQLAPGIDQGAIDDNGPIVQDPVSLHSICDPNVANLVAQLIVQRSANIRTTYTFTLPWTFFLLSPMDLVTLTSGSLNKTLVRITMVDENDDGDLDFTAEEMLVGTSHVAAIQRQTNQSYKPNTGLDPGNVSAPTIFNPPLSLTGGDFEVWLAASGGPNWGGAEVWVSVDNETYNKLAEIDQPARYGVTTTDFPATADPDTTHALGVDLTASGGTLTSASQAAADAGGTMCVVGSEVISYSDATLTAANKYTLDTYIRRGVAGTTIVDQPVGSAFVRLDSGVATVTYSAEQIGKPIYVKFRSFNVFKQAYQDLATVTAYEFTAEANGTIVEEVTWTSLQGIPLALQSLTADGGSIDSQYIAVPSGDAGSAPQSLTAWALARYNDIVTNSGNIAAEVLRGQSFRAYQDGLNYLAGVPIGTVITNVQEQVTDNNTALVDTLLLLGAKNGNGTAFLVNANTLQVNSDGTSLVQALTSLTATTGANTTSINLLETATSGLTGMVTLTVNTNGHVTGFEIYNTATTGSFTIVADEFAIVDPNGGSPFSPFVYSSGVIQMLNVEIDTLAVGTVTTLDVESGAITNTPFMNDTTSRSLGSVGSAAVTVCTLAETVSGGPVKIDVTIRFLNTDGSHDQQVTMLLLRDGTQVDEPFDLNVRENSSGFSGGYGASTSASFLDTGASAGAHTWTVTAQLIGGNGTNTTCNFCRMILQDLKTEL